MTTTNWMILLSGTLALATFACGGDDDAEPTGTGGSGGSVSTGGTGGSGGDGGDGGTGGDGGATGGGGQAPAAEYAVLVRGDLFTSDLAEAQAYHDPLASGGEQAAKDLGDFGHDAMLGTDLLGTTVNAFLGLDRWDDADGLATFYGDPQFAQAFGMLFAEPPTVETFVHQAEWHGWGDLTSGDSAPQHYFVVVRGHLAEADPAAAQAAHDAVAAGGEATATMLGDQAHVVFTGLEDPQEFMAIDIWHDSANIEALYTNPDFAMAFATLFDSEPTLAVYASTDWHQW